MRCTVVAALFAASAVYGCGTETAAEPETQRASTASPAAAEQARDERPHRRYRRCHPAGLLISGPLTLCQKRPNTESSGSFKVGRRDAQRRLDVKHPFGRTPHGTLHGSWIWAAASPDGKTILAQFSGECEVPMAFFVAATGGAPRSVSGSYTFSDPPEDSKALGWTTDGRAIVFIPAEPGCGSTDRAGVFLMALSGENEKVASVRPREQPKLKPSVRARSVASIKQTLSTD